MSLYENHISITPHSPIIIRRTTTKNTVGNLHWHENIELLYCVDGGGKAAIDTQFIDLKRGDLVIVNSSRTHYFISNGYAVYYCLIISTDFLKKSGIDLNKYEFCEHIYDENLLKYFETIHNEYLEGCEVATKAATLALMTHLFKNYLRPVQKEAFDDNIKKAIKYMKRHYNEKITLEDIAKAAGLSRFYFSRHFKAYTNNTVVNYLRQIRCFEAESLLKNTDCSITEIALECGFEDIAYFTRVFKKEMGILPSQVRKDL